MESKIVQNYGPHTQGGVEAMHYDRVQSHLPLNTMPNVVGRKAKFYDDSIAHPDYDDYSKPLSVEERYNKIAVPVHTFGGWFDIFSQSTLRGYVGMAQKAAMNRAKKIERLIIGPSGPRIVARSSARWTSGRTRTSIPTRSSCGGCGSSSRGSTTGTRRTRR